MLKFRNYVLNYRRARIDISLYFRINTQAKIVINRFYKINYYFKLYYILIKKTRQKFQLHNHYRDFPRNCPI